MFTFHHCADPKVLRLLAVFMSRALTVSGESVESFCSIRATEPETTGAAMLVPLSMKYE